MRRGQERDQPARAGDAAPGPQFSKRELMEAGGVSAKTFDLIRKAARVRGPGHGGLDWCFGIEEIRLLIRRAESGTFTERGGSAAEGWRRLIGE